MIEYGPAVHVRQFNIQRDGVRPVLSGQYQCCLPAGRHQRLETAFMGKIPHRGGERRVVFYDENYSVAGLDQSPVIVNGFRYR